MNKLFTRTHPFPLQCCEFLVNFSLCVWHSQHYFTRCGGLKQHRSRGGRGVGSSDILSFVFCTVSRESSATLSQSLLARIVGFFNKIVTYNRFDRWLVLSNRTIDQIHSIEVCLVAECLLRRINQAVAQEEHCISSPRHCSCARSGSET